MCLSLENLQVAGHFTNDDVPTLMQTPSGDILKPLTRDVRGCRELELYTLAESARSPEKTHIQHAHPYSSLPSIAGHVCAPATESVIRVTDGQATAVEYLQGIVAYIPRCCTVYDLTCVVNLQAPRKHTYPRYVNKVIHQCFMDK